MEIDNEELVYGIDAPARNIIELTIATQEILKSFLNTEHEEEIITKHIKTYINNDALKPIQFGKGLDWFNVSESLTIQDSFKDHVVVLDFFTYCCINCLHILPDLERLEQEFPPNKSPVIVVGVHSGKFDNEKLSGNVCDALKKFGISHPVANDPDCDLWNKLEISCWPTLIILAPGGVPLFVLMGEGNGNNLMKFVNATLSYLEISRSFVPALLPLSPLEVCRSRESELYYPGKVASFERNLVIADSGNHRIIVASTDGLVKHTIGCGLKGFMDGCFESARFNNPQGVCLRNDEIFVADTDNNAIRKICLKTEMVETIAGTGAKGEDLEGGFLWNEQEISSPWDVCLGRTLDSDIGDEPNLLFIAMAGTHQIWGVFLSGGKWLKNSYHEKGTVIRLAGSGVEENRNTSYPLKAGFAQPSGISCSAADSAGPALYIADSESSSIRQMSCTTGAVTRLAGGGRDPNDLFSFGDKCGVASQSKFQHPLGVAHFGGFVYVADSYNHKIKIISMKDKHHETSTLIGNEDSEHTEQPLNEPGGLCVNRSLSCLFIADTNNSSIKEFNLIEKSLKTVQLDFSKCLVKNGNGSLQSSKPESAYDFAVTSGASSINLTMKLNLPPHLNLTPDANHSYSLKCSGNVVSRNPSGPIYPETSIPLDMDVKVKENATVRIDSKVFLCHEDSCSVWTNAIQISFFSQENTDNHHSYTVHLNPKL